MHAFATGSAMAHKPIEEGTEKRGASAPAWPEPGKLIWAERVGNPH